MRQLSLIAVIAFLGLTFLPGCSKSGGSSTPATTYAMKATIGSASLNASVCIASVVGGALAISGSTVSGGTGGPPQINIAVTSWTGTTGTYAIGGIASTVFAQYQASSGTLTSVSNSGTLTISSVSTTVITGTFSFTTTDGKSITGGTFTAQRM